MQELVADITSHGLHERGSLELHFAGIAAVTAWLPLELQRVLAVVEEARARQQTLAEEAPEMLEALRGLSCREREVLAWLAEGQTDPEIAEALGISSYTVTTHVRNLLGKLGVKNRVQAAVLWDRYTRGRQRR